MRPLVKGGKFTFYGIRVVVNSTNPITLFAEEVRQVEGLPDFLKSVEHERFTQEEFITLLLDNDFIHSEYEEDVRQWGINAGFLELELAPFSIENTA